MLITSKSNPVIKLAQSLNDKKFRKQYGLFLVEGTKPVKECIAAGCLIERIICVEGLETEFTGATVVTESVFNSISSEKTPQGVMAVVKMSQTHIKPPEKPCLLLDCIQDPGNLGTIVRTANAAGYSEIYLINCTDPYSPKAVRASMSGIFFVTVYQGKQDEVFNALKGIPLICTDMSGKNVFTFEPPQKFCLCIGNEGAGISDEVKKRATDTISIPMRSTCESLNAAVSAGIAMYELRKNNIER